MIAYIKIIKSNQSNYLIHPTNSLYSNDRDFLIKEKVITTEKITESGEHTGSPLQINYKYDGNGNRVASIVDGNRTNLLVDANRRYAQVVMESDSEGDITASYLFAGRVRSGSISRMEDDGNRGKNMVSPVHYYYYDGHGSVVFLADADGNITDKYNYI